MKTIIKTERLIIRKAKPTGSDVDLFYRLWTNPKVMIYVGFPYGLRITKDEIKAKIKDEFTSKFDSKLIVQIAKTSELVGECKLGLPNDDGISETDVKILPEFWGKGYGTEIKQALVDYLFANTDCKIIQATPNKKNIASIKMQEAVGGKRIREEIYKFPKRLQASTCDIPLYIYHVFREDWESSS